MMMMMIAKNEKKKFQINNFNNLECCNRCRRKKKQCIGAIRQLHHHSALELSYYRNVCFCFFFSFVCLFACMLAFLFIVVCICVCARIYIYIM